HATVHAWWTQPASTWRRAWQRSYVTPLASSWLAETEREARPQLPPYPSGAEGRDTSTHSPASVSQVSAPVTLSAAGRQSSSNAQASPASLGFPSSQPSLA